MLKDLMDRSWTWTCASRNNLSVSDLASPPRSVCQKLHNAFKCYYCDLLAELSQSPLAYAVTLVARSPLIKKYYI